ncbi:MAG: hypothetical protein AB8B99_12375 [Phormidesmis sp.]
MKKIETILFIIDPIHVLEPGHDTSLGLMEAAIKNGDRVFITTPKGFVIDSGSSVGNVYAEAQEITAFVPQQHPTKNKLVSTPIVQDSVVKMVLDCQPGIDIGSDCISAPDAVLQRQDDRGDWSTQQIVANLHPSICVLNKGAATLSAEDKVAVVTEFPHLCPPSIATADAEKLINFGEKMKDEGDQRLVLKATQSYGGNDVNIINLVSEDWQQQVYAYAEEKVASNRPVIVAQKFLPDVKDGDMRIFYVNGKPIAAVNRMPSQEGKLANMAQGGTGVAVSLEDISPSTVVAAHQVVEWGKKQGIVIVGVDVIGKETPYITEFNPGSPTGLIEAQEQLGQDVCSVAWAAVKEAIHEHQVTHSNLFSLHWQFLAELVQRPEAYPAKATSLAQRWLVNKVGQT